MKAKHTATVENDHTLKLIINSAIYTQPPTITAYYNDYKSDRSEHTYSAKHIFKMPSKKSETLTL